MFRDHGQWIRLLTSLLPRTSMNEAIVSKPRKSGSYCTMSRPTRIRWPSLYLNLGHVVTSKNGNNLSRNLYSSRVRTSTSPSSHRGQLKRGAYAVLDAKDLVYFDTVLGKDRVVRDETILESHNIDWTGSYKGSSQLLLQPRNTKEVSDILSYCNRRRLAICPQGGNTGLVGGGVPVFDEIILSTRLLNKVIDLDPTSGVLVCESGCVLELLDDRVGIEGLMMPLDLGARGSCHIGGNVATNAGGLRLLRYGSLHGNILGLEIVKADGVIVDCMSTLRKDNTGYHLKQLFIGSEGTLGVVTKVAIQCSPKPTSTNLAFLGCKSFDDVLKTYKEARTNLREVLSAFELIDQESLVAVQKYYELRSPIEPVSRFPFYVLLETSGSNQTHDDEKMNTFVERVLEHGCVEDGGIYSEPSKMKSLWALREAITAATLKDGYVFKYDISLPLNSLYDIIINLRDRLGAKVMRCNGFGHVGDSNIHVTVTTERYDHDVHDLLEPYIFQWVAEHHGSISAEHGVGLQKRDYIHLCKSAEAIQIMHSLKRYFDPNGILNPYKVLP